METFTIIKYLFFIGIVFYVTGLLLAWFYETRKNVLYQKMRKQIKLLESFGQKSAVTQIRLYRINQDYDREVLKLERVQQFILENMLLIRRSPLKIKKT